MNLVPPLPAHAESTIGQFLRAHALAEGLRGVVVGLSGGIDSALTARLARDALGAEAVHAVLLPDRGFPSSLLAETQRYAEDLGTSCQTLPIAPVEEAVRTLLPSVNDRVALGNVKARLRMVLLHAIAREHRALVAGTGNKSELLLGYFTKYGDGGADLLPLGDLYQAQVRALAEQLGLPAAIRERAQTAGLWEGQTDEGELGMPYAGLDRILYGMERLYNSAEIAASTGLPTLTVVAIEQRVHASRHKRRMPPIPKVGLRTIGLDWRE